MRKSVQFHDKFYWVFAISLALLLMAYAWLGYTAVPFHADEADHLYKSLDYVVAIVEHRPADLAAQLPIEPNSTEHIRVLTGNLHAVLTGFALHQSGVTSENWPQAWYFPQSVEWNIQNGRWPSEDILAQGRLPHVLAVMLSIPLVLLIFWLWKPQHWRTSAIVGMILLGTQPSWLLSGRRVMQESVLLLTTLLLLALALWLHDGRRWWKYGWLALMAGLCVVAKPTGLISVLGVYLGVLWLTWRNEQKLRHTIYLTWGGVLAIVIYGIFTPALWKHPNEIIRFMVEERAEVLQGQTAASQHAYDSTLEQWVALVEQPFLVELQYYETPAFEGYLDAEISAYEHDHYAGWQYGQVIAGFWTASACLGLVQLIQRWRAANNSIMLTWILIVGISTGMSVSLAWQRYYLLWTVASIFLAALGLSVMVQWLIGFKRFLK